MGVTQKVQFGQRIPRWIMIFPLMMVIFCSVLLFFFLQEKSENDRFMETAVPINAECTEIHMFSDIGEDGTEYYYRADVQYEYDGAIYQADDFKVTESTLKGDTIRIYISPENPSDARIPMSSAEAVFSIAIWSVMIIIGVIMTLIAFKMSCKPKADVREPWEMK